MMNKYTVLSVAALAMQAQALTLYQQCGGQGWTGSGTCPTSATCSGQNQYYSQCVPATAAPAPAPATTLSTVTTTKATSVAPVSTTKASSASSSVVNTSPATSPTPTASSGTVGNIFAGKQIYANPYYASEISASAIPSLSGTLAAKASAVAKVGTFVWLDTAAKVPTMDTYLTNIEALNKAGASPPVMGAFVVYDLPDRDCAALASNGEYSVANNGLANYKAYIDSIAAIVKKHPSTSIALIIEPDSLGNLVTNLNVAKCQEAQPAYLSGVEYALATLNLPNVAMYMDAGHAGWLGWAANIAPAAQLFSQVYNASGRPSQLRGLSTNVANYNAFSIATCPSYTQGDANCDESRYYSALAPLLTSLGFPAHFIMDTARNGVQPTAQTAWGDWCNVKGTGFGVRPTTTTGNALVDAFVWVKPGGESDGTSDSSAARYDAHCGYSDALQGAPEAGTWFEAYFAQLLQNAVPSF